MILNLFHHSLEKNSVIETKNDFEDFHDVVAPLIFFSKFR